MPTGSLVSTPMFNLALMRQPARHGFEAAWSSRCRRLPDLQEAPGLAFFWSGPGERRDYLYPGRVIRAPIALVSNGIVQRDILHEWGISPANRCTKPSPCGCPFPRLNVSPTRAAKKPDPALSAKIQGHPGTGFGHGPDSWTSKRLNRIAKRRNFFIRYDDWFLPCPFPTSSLNIRSSPARPWSSIWLNPRGGSQGQGPSALSCATTKALAVSSPCAGDCMHPSHQAASRKQHR